MDLERKAYREILAWKLENNGASALLIEGARRTGKSYIVKKFAENEYKSHIIIDFSKFDQTIIDIFEVAGESLDNFFTNLSVKKLTKLHERESLIVFDEVQQYPKARQLIKHLVADGRYDYIETGSLISLKRNVKDILIPSEEDSIEMFPLDFEEYLWAQGAKLLADYARECFEEKKPMGQPLHRKMMRYFREYMIVGGMPQSVMAFLEKKDFTASNKAKQKILKLYKTDVTKFAEGYESKVISIFEQIPSALSKKDKKFILASLTKTARYRTYEDAFIWLIEANIINAAFNVTDPMIGLRLTQEENTMKCYLADTGLLYTHTFKGQKSEEFYKKVLFDKLSLNEGMLMENIVAQMLMTAGHHLNYYSKIDTENSANTMEIDFLIEEEGKISPIEVKSSSYTAHKSLDKFTSKFKKRIGKKYIIYTKDFKILEDIICLPIYMTMFL
ncbi:MAG: ATP-binding protein [Anaerovoracaceae bacterium]